MAFAGFAAAAGTPALVSVAEVNRILRSATETAPRRVTFRGVVIHWANHPRGIFVQADKAGVFVACRRDLTLPGLGDEVEITSDVRFTDAGPDTEVEALTLRVSGHPGLPELQRCSLVESTDGKFNRLAVEVQGTVLAVSRHYGVPWLMLSDSSGAAMAGVYSWPQEWKAEALVGRRVRLRGVAAGVWHQALRCSTPDEITVLGAGGNDGSLPALGTVAEVLKDAPRGSPLQPVVLKAECSRASPAERQFTLRDGHAEVVVNVPRYDPGSRMPQAGDMVRITGVALPASERARINAWSVQILVSASPDGRQPASPAVPRVSVREVLNAPVSSGRLAISGTVLVSASSGPVALMVVQDATGSAYVYGPDGGSSDSSSMPQPGDRVEVEGVRRSHRDASPQLFDAAWRVTGRATLPEPPLVSMADAMSISFDGKRVRLSGRLVDFETFVERGQYVSRLWLRSGDVVTYGNYIGPQFVPAPAKLGQLVEITGVCNVSRIAPNVVRTFSVQIQSMADARPLPEPPPWSDPVFRRTLIFIAVAFVAAAAWLLLLRRQVRLRTASLAAREVELQGALTREQELGNLKTAFISMVSHEFRTPLNVIITSSDILSRYFDRLPAEERGEHLGSIQKSIKRMAGMMEDVLLLGRFDAGQQKLQPAELHLPAWCRRFVDEMISATGGRCPIDLELGDFEPIVHADESILRHVIANLLSNGVKYSRAGAAVHLRVHREGRDAVFQVIDDGVGIPMDDQKRLFEAFQRGANVGHISGTGLGLVVVKRGVELHGGIVSFTSEEGRGTTFTVRLPVFEETQQPSTE